MDKWPKVAVIVLNWNGWRDTIECLESLQRITYPNYQIIVVDNGSTDDSVQKIKAWARGEIRVESRFFEYDPYSKPVQWTEYDRETADLGGKPEEESRLELLPSSGRVVLIQSGDNLGFAGGNNVGIRYALRKNAEWVMLLNNDTVVDTEFLDSLVKAAEIGKNVGILGPKIYFYDDSNIIQSVGAKMNLWTGRGKLIGFKEAGQGYYDQIYKVDWVSGAAIMVKRDVFVKIGLLDERFFLCYEENDLCHRARRVGFIVLAAPTSKVWHKEAAPTGKPIAEYYLTRNRLLFMKKNAKGWQYFSFLSFYLLGTVKRVSLYLFHGDKELAKAVLKGLWHGVYVLMGKELKVSNYKEIKGSPKS